jgi:Domain of unknown function (DUF4388)
MFDVVVCHAHGASFALRVASALREARMRVILVEHAAPRVSSVLRVDAGVACASTTADMLEIARALRVSMDGPPVVGVTALPEMTRSREVLAILPIGVASATLVACVQRVATEGERRRNKVMLRGEADDVGIDSLLATLAARGKSCTVKVRYESARGEITLERGSLVDAMTEGVHGGLAGKEALEAIRGWRGGTFEVVSDAGGRAATRRAVSQPPRAAFPADDAADVALAAAVVNACSAYARSWLGPLATARLLEATWKDTKARHPELEAFQVSADGMVSVSGVSRARVAIPEAVARWIRALFDGGAAIRPASFRRDHIREVLGGLSRLVEQVGWAAALYAGERT